MSAQVGQCITNRLGWYYMPFSAESRVLTAIRHEQTRSAASSSLQNRVEKSIDRIKLRKLG